MRAYLDSLESLSKKQLMLLLARKRRDETEPMAVVGMSCRLPGDLDTPDAFWAALRDGRVVAAPPGASPTDSQGRPRWNVTAPDLAPLADLLAKGRYLSAIDLFDADYFDIDPAEAADIDPHQRLLLTCAAEALADANLTRDDLRDCRVGVFTGVSTTEYHHARLRNGVTLEGLSPYVASGGTLSATAGRLAHRLGLHGPAITIDTACSSALTALHLATAALRRRECDVAVVGACHLLLSPWTTASFARTGVLSDTNSCRPFAADADGYVRGEGCGVLVLRRYQDARADGTAPHALVRGSAVDQYGDRLTLSSVSSAGQRRVITQALEQAQVPPDQVGYVEAQANGDRLAAAVEIESLAAAYRRDTPDAPTLYVGSCKANLGYLETASGIASLIKAILVVRHGAIPPQPNVSVLDPAVNWHRMSIAVPNATIPWPAKARRLVGVSAFGFTGTYAHAVLDAAPTPTEPTEPSAPAVLAVSAHNAEACRRTARRLHAHLSADTRWTTTAVCRTLAVGRDVGAVRAAAVVHDRVELLDALRRIADDPRDDRPDDTPPGLLLRLPALTADERDTAEQACHAPGFDTLRLRVTSTVAALDGGPWDLAWALAWLDLFHAIRLEFAAAEFGGAHRALLADVFTGRLTTAQACAEWREHRATADVRVGRWAVVDRGDTLLVTQPHASAALTPVELHRFDTDTWLRFVADQFVHGRLPHLPGLWAHPREALLHLPPPVFTATSHWPDHNRWY